MGGVPLRRGGGLDMPVWYDNETVWAWYLRRFTNKQQQSPALNTVPGPEVQADPEVVEEWKWDVPVWSRDGLICTGETYKNVVKMTFAKGASLADPSGLFNSSLEGNTRRAIDIHEGDKINEKALKALIREAVVLNTSKPASGARKK